MSSVRDPPEDTSWPSGGESRTGLRGGADQQCAQIQTATEIVTGNLEFQGEIAVRLIRNIDAAQAVLYSCVAGTNRYHYGQTAGRVEVAGVKHTVSVNGDGSHQAKGRLIVPMLHINRERYVAGGSSHLPAGVLHGRHGRCEEWDDRRPHWGSRGSGLRSRLTVVSSLRAISIRISVAPEPGTLMTALLPKSRQDTVSHSTDSSVRAGSRSGSLDKSSRATPTAA